MEIQPFLRIFVMFRIVPILLFLCLLVPVQAMAASGPAYTVNDVKVDIVAESAVKARNQAFTAAQTQAFKMLATRFLGPEEQANFVPPQADAIAGMVADFEIKSEQLSKRRYLGIYVFRFKASAINRFFGHGPLEGADEAAMPTQARLIILPTFTQNGKTVLWDAKQNPWLQAWQAQDMSDYPFMIVPKSDVSDTMDIRSPDPAKITNAALKRIRARYGAQDVVILAAIFDQSAKDMLKIQVYRTDTGKSQLVQTFSVPPGKATKLGQLLTMTVPQMKTYLAGNWKNQNLMSRGEQNTDTGLGGSADDGTQYATAADYPDYNPENYGGGTPPVAGQPSQIPAPVTRPQAGSVKAVARFSSMNEWLAIRRSLNDIASLSSIRILGLSTNKADLQLDYSDWSGLVQTLNGRGLSLQSMGPGMYNLSRTANFSGNAR